MTRAIAALLDIMADTGAPIRRRIEATDSLLTYEAPDEAVEEAKAFLISVFEDRDQHVMIASTLQAIIGKRRPESALRQRTAIPVTNVPTANVNGGVKSHTAVWQ